SGVYTQDNSNLFWDRVNKRLGVGMGTPAFEVDILAQASLGGLNLAGTQLGGNGNAAAAAILTVAGAAGQANTGAGGAGGAASITGGAGGQSGTSNGPLGGALTFTGGVGGAHVSVSGATRASGGGGPLNLV